MGAVSSWLLQCLYPEDQLVWQAARAGDAGAVRAALARLTPETQRWIEWQEPCSGRTALAAAAAAGHAECARLLLLAGADADSRDAKGNSPLHLACKRGHPAVLAALLESPRARPFGTNLCLKTPLDVARHRFAKEEEDEGPTRGFQECIEMLEKRFCLYSGWMYQKTDNVLSYVSGISSLNSWTRRFCIVLERGAPEILELALFNMKSSGFSRPVCPSSVVLYHVPAGLRPTTDGKWFNRKEHTFTLFAALKDMKAHCESPTIMQPMEFAAVDREGYEAWKSFFDYHQENIPRSSQNRAPHHIHPQPTVQRFQPTTQPVHRPEPARRSVSEEEDEDLRRAIQLSLQTAPPSHLNAAAVSAPDWDGEDPYGYPVKPREHETNAALQEDAHADHTATTEAHSPPVVDFAQAPPYSSIGECVICFDGPQAAVCVPCGHNAVCMSCAEEILETSCECPVCRQPIRELIKLYRV